jgi:6-phosphogluconolactonase (cycloisomerase 2 family)
MKKVFRVAAGAAVAAGVSFAAPALAGASASGGSGNTGQPQDLVFVQTDNLSGNSVAVYRQSRAGTLTLTGTFATDGLGGALTGSVVDHLASEGSLVYDQAHRLLYAVNAGSNTFSVFSVDGDRLVLRQVLSSGGRFPASLAVHGSVVYVLNALDGGNVTGFRWGPFGLQPIPGSTRALGLTTPTNATQFTHTPGQVAFSPGGAQLIVTTKAGGQSIDVFGVSSGGMLSPTPTVNPEPGTVPFAVAFGQGTVLVANAGTDAVTSFTLASDGVLSAIATQATGQKATCWITSARGAFFASNAGSGSVSSLGEQETGQLNLLATTPTDAGTVDATPSVDRQFLYVQTGASGIVDEFGIGHGGVLNKIGSVTVTGAAGGEGIAAG